MAQWRIKSTIHSSRKDGTTTSVVGESAIKTFFGKTEFPGSLKVWGCRLLRQKGGWKSECTSTKGFTNLLLQNFGVNSDFELGTSETTVRKEELDRGVDHQCWTSTVQVRSRVLEVVFSEVLVPTSFDESIIVGIYSRCYEMRFDIRLIKEAWVWSLDFKLQLTASLPSKTTNRARGSEVWRAMGDRVQRWLCWVWALLLRAGGGDSGCDTSALGDIPACVVKIYFPGDEAF